MRVAGGFGVAPAVATISCALASGTAAAPTPAYRGAARGVVLILTVLPSRGYGLLTIRFSTAAEPIRQRALRASRLDVFCAYPLKDGGGIGIAHVTIGSRQRSTTAVVATAYSAERRYTCGLHVHTNAAGDSWPWNHYMRGAIVVARRARAPSRTPPAPVTR